MKSRRHKSTSSTEKTRHRSSSSSRSAPLHSSGPRSDCSRGRDDALQSFSGDGAAATTGSGGAAPPSSSSATNAKNDNAVAAAAGEEEEPATIGGGIFRAISDAASQEGPLQGKAFDSYAFGPPVRVLFALKEGKRGR